ncbi:hypothetical protein BC628DRAFT_933455 [Trametes gibbosa]|nr:hypothetical protein BC628DRAFT_933455 [Trametes gibbosa]
MIKEDIRHCMRFWIRWKSSRNRLHVARRPTKHRRSRSSRNESQHCRCEPPRAYLPIQQYGRTRHGLVCRSLHRRARFMHCIPAPSARISLMPHPHHRRNGHQGRRVRTQHTPRYRRSAATRTAIRTHGEMPDGLSTHNVDVSPREPRARENTLTRTVQSTDRTACSPPVRRLDFANATYHMLDTA